MAKLKIKILSSGKIPGYATSGPVLNPIEMTEKEVLNLICMGLDVRVYNEKLNEYKKYNLVDMLDVLNDKPEMEVMDERHECDICDGDITIHPVSHSQVESMPSESVYVESDRYTHVEDDTPDFGGAYEAPPVEAFGLDDFEEK